jgi:hypothetical protein
VGFAPSHREKLAIQFHILRQVQEKCLDRIRLSIDGKMSTNLMIYNRRSYFLLKTGLCQPFIDLHPIVLLGHGMDESVGYRFG